MLQLSQIDLPGVFGFNLEACCMSCVPIVGMPVGGTCASVLCGDCVAACDAFKALGAAFGICRNVNAGACTRVAQRWLQAKFMAESDELVTGCLFSAAGLLSGRL